MQDNKNIKDLFPLPHTDTSYFDLSQGEIYIDLKRDVFIWGITFQKATFKEKTKLQLQISFRRDTDSQNIGYTDSLSKHNNEWINPDGSDPNIPMEIEFDPADMDEGGCIFFTKPGNSGRILRFITSKVKIRGVSGQLSKILFDFVGTTITYDGGHGLMRNPNYHLTKKSTDYEVRFIENFYYTGKLIVLKIVLSTTLSTLLQRTPLLI